MNYWRRYTADYGSKTGALTMTEDGAYTRLLDWYYEHEKPLPLVAARIYVIARAMSPPDKRAVDHVLKTYFERREDGWHNRRADEELAEALPKLDTLRRVARENGAKGGRPKKTESGSFPQPYPQPNPVSEPVTEREPEQEPEPEPKRDPDPEPSSQPLNLTENPNTAFPVVTTSEASAAAANSGTEKNPTAETRRQGLLALLTKHRVMGIAENPLIVERILAAARDEHIVQAFHEAGRSKGGAPYEIGYFETIASRIGRAARVAEAAQRDAAERKFAETQAQIAEQRNWQAAPKPENFPVIRKAAGA